MRQPCRVVFVNSHPIQYFAPMYAEMARGGIPVEAWYCSDESLRGSIDSGFNVPVAWDIPLLEGYSSRFYRNRALRKGIDKGFFGLVNPGLLIALLHSPPAVVVVHGWNYFTHLLVLIAARFLGHRVAIRGESPLNQDVFRSRLARWVRNLYLRILVFPCVSWFFYIGTQNRRFYRHLKVPEAKLVFTPYAVDNCRLTQSAHELAPKRAAIRSELGLENAQFVILFVGKYAPKKRPLDLLEAYRRNGTDSSALVFAGDGPLRSAMESYIHHHRLSDVVLTGFVNQSRLPLYYAAADLLVLPSEQGETWGLVVNEALNFGLPVVVSDVPGSGFDLVAEGRNGYRYTCGDIDQLAAAIVKARELDNVAIRAANNEILATYSYATTATALHQLLGSAAVGPAMVRSPDNPKSSSTGTRTVCAG